MGRCHFTTGEETPAEIENDFDGDGKADILWRNTTTGQVSVWLINGAAKLSGGSPGTVPVEWEIQ